MSGKVRLLIEKPAPDKLACVIVTDDAPVLVSVSDRFVLPPTCTLPKASVVGLADKVPAVTPVPESAILKLGLLPFEVMLMLPLTAPLAVGANFTVNEVLCPAVKVRGNVSPLKLYPAPLADAAEMVRLDPPEFVNV